MDPGQLEILRQLNGAYEDATAEEVELLERFLTTAKQALDLATQVDVLNGSVAATTTDLRSAEAAVARADREGDDIDRRLTDTEQQLDLEQQRLREQAIESYIGGGTGGGNASSDAIMRSATVNDLGKTLVYADVVVVDQRATVERVSELRAEVERLQVASDAVRDEARASRDLAARHRTTIVGQRDQQEQTRLQVEQIAKDQAELVKAVAEKREEYAKRLALMSRVSDSISATLAAAEAGQTVPLNTAGIFLSPIPNPSFNSPFGPRANPFGGAPGMHNGVDINGSMGTPIRAVADGVVVIAGDVGGYGNCTVIDHGSGLGTLYGHQSVVNVLVGDIVKRGQIIGLVGSTGNSTGPHLHWEVRKLGQPTDPVPFIGPG